MLHTIRLLPLLLGLAVPLEAASQTRELGRSGAWTAYAGLTDEGVPVCGMDVRGSEDRVLHVKWFLEDEKLTMQAMKASWSIPADTEVRLVLDVDGRVSWTVPSALGSGRIVEWTVTTETFDEFVTAFRAGRTLTLRFPGGDEAPWVVSLRGSMATFDIFAACVVETEAANQAATPPARNQRKDTGPTQPFGR